MKNRSICLLLSFAIWCAEIGVRSETSTTNAPFGKQVLRFRNGDFLFGSLESISPDKTVTWRRGDVLQAMEFSGTNLLEIQFPSVKQAKVSATNGCRIALRNGDSLEGKLLQITSDKIVLDTSFAGKMTFPRDVVELIEPLPAEREPIFSGPTGLDGWTMGKVNAFAANEAGEWKYTNGAFYATHAASIARDMKLPDVARIEFDLAWKDVLQSAVALYTSYLQPVNLQTKDAGPDFGGFYSLQINSFVSTLMPVRRDEPLKYMGQIPVPGFSQKNHAHVEILASKPRHSIALLVDGALVKEWIDTEGFAGTGTGMRFVHQGQGAVKLSNLRISEWNGKMESKSTNHLAEKEDVARLLNGDKVSGRLDTFRDGKLTYFTANGKLDIPFERVSENFFAANSGKTFLDKPENVRAFFHDGGRVTFQIERWDGQGVVASSPLFGRVTFAPGTFERARFNRALISSVGEEEEKKQFE